MQHSKPTSMAPRQQGHAAEYQCQIYMRNTNEMKSIVIFGKRMLRMELPGRRKRGRPKRRFTDVPKEDMAEVEETEEDTEVRNNWRRKIRCGDP